MRMGCVLVVLPISAIVADAPVAVARVCSARLAVAVTMMMIAPIASIPVHVRGAHKTAQRVSQCNRCVRSADVNVGDVRAAVVPVVHYARTCHDHPARVVKTWNAPLIVLDARANAVVAALFVSR